MSAPLLQVKDLGTSFELGGGRTLRAAHEVSFTVDRGQTLALVGESGSGKSTIAKLLLRLVQAKAGQVLLDGEDILKSEPRGASKAYRRRVQMIFQDPFGSLNPAHKVLHHLARPLLLHGHATQATVREQALALLHDVGLRPAEQYIDAHTFALSGGQRQRVAIARALAVQPDIIVADEPTSMLDVSIRMDILSLLARLREERGVAIVFITHDLGAARWLCDRILVLYGGQMMELAEAESLVKQPRHPYSQLLMAAAPRAGGSVTSELPAKSGAPKTIDPPPGCPFVDRCGSAMDVCKTTLPPLHAAGPDHAARCHLLDADLT